MPMPHVEKLKRKVYESELAKLQVELCYLQDWVKTTGERIIIVLEGRDAAGKGGAIKVIVGHLDPRHYTVVNYGAMSGEPIVYGGLVFAWLAGLASRDTTENALIDLHFLGIDNVLALQGDAIKTEARFVAEPGGHRFASELLEQIEAQDRTRAWKGAARVTLPRTP